MAVTKTAQTLQSSASNSAGGTTTGTGLDLTTKLGGLLTGKITNGGTGPTVTCSLRIDVSVDNSAWKTFRTLAAALGNSVVTEFAVDIPPSVMYVRTVFTGNTAQAVTVEAFLHELTTV